MAKHKDTINFIKPIPLPHLQSGGGLLPDSMEACALWMFCVGAMQALNTIPNQVTLVGQQDLTSDLMQVAHSNRRIYELDTLEGMFSTQLIDAARAEATRCGLPWDVRLDMFFETGGKAYRFLDRDANKVMQ